MKLRLLLISVCIAFAGVIASPAGAQDRPRPVPPDSAERWKEMSPAQRNEVLRRYREFNTLTSEKKQELEERHRSLDEVRDQVLASLSEAERQRIEGLEGKARERALRPHVRRYLEAARKQMLESAGLPEGEPKPPPFRDIRRAFRTRAIDELMRLEQEGFLEEGEAERLVTLSAHELKQELVQLQKRLILKHPPREFLELPSEQRDQIMALPDDQFVKKMQRFEGKNRKRRLPRMMDDVLHDRPFEPRPIPDKVLRRVLRPHQLRELKRVRGPERRARIRQMLMKNVRELLKRRGDDPGQLEELRALSPELREQRLIRMLESRPGVRNRGPGRPPRDGQGPPRKRPRR